MMDYKLKTFLKLYDTMNYRAAASALNLTQPAVTQHIHALENEYGCSLFHYDGRRLHRTAAAEKLAVYARSMLYNEQRFLQEVGRLPAQPLRIGATKSIGNYVIGGMLAKALEDPETTLTLTVDNTRALLAQLQRGELDFALIEGHFDKQIYGHCLLRHEPLWVFAPGSIPWQEPRPTSNRCSARRCCCGNQAPAPGSSSRKPCRPWATRRSASTAPSASAARR